MSSIFQSDSRWCGAAARTENDNFTIGSFKRDPIFTAFNADSNVKKNEISPIGVFVSGENTYNSNAPMTGGIPQGSLNYGCSSVGSLYNKAVGSGSPLSTVPRLFNGGNMGQRCFPASPTTPRSRVAQQLVRLRLNEQQVMNPPRGHVRVVSPPRPKGSVITEKYSAGARTAFNRAKAIPPRGFVGKNQVPVQIRGRFGSLGAGNGFLNSPHGFCLGPNEDVVVCDTNNHRVEVFRKDGQFRYAFGIPGREEGQLWFPRKVAYIKNSSRFVVCDRGTERSRMQLFTKQGQFIKKIAVRYIDIVAGMTTSDEGHIVAVDSVSPSCFIISEQGGELLHWFDCANYMKEPSDVAVWGGNFFICDFKGHCVVVFSKAGEFMHRVGCESIIQFPNGIDVSGDGDIVVGDSHGNRLHVSVFSQDGKFTADFVCPNLTVSRCCGLKLTMEGYVVTVAKNNHEVLMLPTLHVD